MTIQKKCSIQVQKITESEKPSDFRKCAKPLNTDAKELECVVPPVSLLCTDMADCGGREENMCRSNISAYLPPAKRLILDQKNQLVFTV